MAGRQPESWPGSRLEPIFFLFFLRDLRSARPISLCRDRDAPSRAGPRCPPRLKGAARWRERTWSRRRRACGASRGAWAAGGAWALGAGRGAAASAPPRSGPRALPGRAWRPLDPPPRNPDRPLRPPACSPDPLPLWIGIIFFRLPFPLEITVLEGRPRHLGQCPLPGGRPSFHPRWLTPRYSRCLMGAF